MEFKKEIGLGFFLLIFAAAYFFGTLNVSTFDPFAASRSGIQLNSRSVPQTLAGLLACLSIIHIIGNFLKLRSKRQEAKLEKKVLRFSLSYSQRIVLLTIAIIFAYIFFYSRLGFVLASFMFLLAQIFLMLPKEKRKKWIVFVFCFSSVVPIVVYLLFTRALAMFLPRGLLWFF
jgi:putative tricarboxylic transport membrane protein